MAKFSPSGGPFGDRQQRPAKKNARAAASRARAPVAEAPSTEIGAEPDLAPVVGNNLRRLRMERSLSLEGLARASGVSRAMLGQIELGHSAPTINVLWKIARALDLPFSALLSAQRQVQTSRVLEKRLSKRLTSHDGTFSSRALFPIDEPRRVEFYELELAAGGVEHAEPHAPGTRENLVVASGRVEIAVGEHVHTLAQGDAMVFDADVPHRYANTGDQVARMYLVMTYAESVR